MCLGNLRPLQLWRCPRKASGVPARECRADLSAMRRSQPAGAACTGSSRVVKPQCRVPYAPIGSNRRWQWRSLSDGALPALEDRILKPRQRKQEERREKVPEEQVYPEQRQIESAKAESYPERSQRSMRFHDSPQECATIELRENMVR
jgi:hypothetical protein